MRREPITLWQRFRNATSRSIPGVIQEQRDLVRMLHAPKSEPFDVVAATALLETIETQREKEERDAVY